MIVDFFYLTLNKIKTKCMKISIETFIVSDINTVWNYYVNPAHITHWNFASDDWQCPLVTNDLVVGGIYKARMEAKDGSLGFDFIATYLEIIENKKISYLLEDKRKVDVSFEKYENEIKILITFDAEQTHSYEMQKMGWQSILNNFKKYVEKHNH